MIGGAAVLAVFAFTLVKITTQPVAISKPGEATSAAKASRVVVFFKNGVFEPREIAARTGDFVTIKNDSREDLEVALGKHEEHESLEGFSEKVLAPGKSYTFQPQEKAEFTFHNHLNPEQSGKLTVE